MTDKKIQKNKSDGKKVASKNNDTARHHIPILRFPDFSDDWEEKKLGEVLKTVPTKSYQIKNSEFLKEGRFKVIDQGKKEIAGYSNLAEKVFKNNRIIVFGDHTTILKYINFDFIVGADGIKLLKNKNDKDNLKFLYYNLFFNNVKQDGYKRHFSLLKEKYLNIPQLPEQEKIASFLTAVDGWVGNLKEQKVEMENYKKGIMQQIFPAKDRSQPTLRFPDFSSDWEEKKLGEIGSIRTSSVDKKIVIGQEKINLLNYMDVYKKNHIYNSDIFQKVTASNSQILSSNLKKGDILFTPSSETPTDIGHSAVIMEDLKKVLFSYHLIRFRSNEDLFIPNFSAYAFKSYKFYKEFWRRAQGATRYTLSKSAIEEAVILFPKKPEQEKIASFLSSLDDIINSTEQKITKAENWKKGLMQKMFV